jgi:hypothetical protein
MALVWLGYGLLLFTIFWLTHGGLSELKKRFWDTIDWFR